MYYGLITVAVLMFGVQFYWNACYQKRNGTGAVATMTYSLIGALVGIVCFCVIGGFDFSVYLQNQQIGSMAKMLFLPAK